MGHDHWATACLLDLSRGLTDAQLDQPFDVGHRTLRATFEHMIFNAEFWTAVMAGPRWMPAARSLAGRGDGTLRALLRGLHDPRAPGARRAASGRTFVDHFGERMTFGGAIVHVVLHDAEHRSEALHILERLGCLTCPQSIMGYGT